MNKAVTEPQFYGEPEKTQLRNIRGLRTDSAAFSGEECTQPLFSHEFYECTFTGVTFRERMSGCLFADVIFDHCDFSNIDLNETVCRRVKFISCRMTGTEWIRSSFQDTVFIGCHCGYANFYGAKWKYCILQDTRFSDAVLSGGKFNDLKISHCDFSRCEFAETKLKDLDFSDSVIDGFLVGPDSLPGVIMNSEQALACAALLGIRIKD